MAESQHQTVEPELIQAVRKGERGAVQSLIASGAKIDARGAQEWTALHYAAGMGDVPMIELLLELGADVTWIGVDRRRPYAVALAAGRREAALLLKQKEQERGAWVEPNRPYVKAFYLRDLRRFKGWSESKKNWHVKESWPEEARALYEKTLEDHDVVFLHLDFTVTRSIWPNEHVLFDDVTTEWCDFCRRDLGFPPAVI